jgi:hypothetical protein
VEIDWLSEAIAAETVIGRIIAACPSHHSESKDGVLDLACKWCLNRHELATDVTFGGKDSRRLRSRLLNARGSLGLLQILDR